MSDERKPLLEWSKSVDNRISQQWDANLGDVRLSVWTHDRDRIDMVADWGGPWWAKAEVRMQRLPSLEDAQREAESQAFRLANDEAVVAWSARLLAASEAAARAEQRALMAEGDAVTMRRERDEARALAAENGRALAAENGRALARIRTLAEQVREAEYAHPRSPLVRDTMTDIVLSADAVADAILATIGGDQ